MAPPLNHLIITRFCCRSDELRGGAALAADSIADRFRSLRIASMASLRAQTSQAFTWVVATDAELPEADKRLLREMLSGVESAVLHEFSPNAYQRDWQTFSWLSPYLGDPDAPTITTYLDDDDGLASCFVEHLQDHVIRRRAEERQPEIVFYGTNRVLQWDFFGSRKAPLGYAKPWTRAANPVSAGYSLYCSTAQIRLAANQFLHTQARWLAGEPAPDLRPDWRRRLDDSRVLIDEALRDAGWSPTKIADRTTRMYRPLDDIVGSEVVAVMMNHLGNMQLRRLFEHPELRQPVVGDTSFQGTVLDLEHAAQVIDTGRWSLAKRVFRERDRITTWPDRYRALEAVLGRR